jgi:hypothetical protein
MRENKEIYLPTLHCLSKRDKLDRKEEERNNFNRF